MLIRLPICFYLIFLFLLDPRYRSIEHPWFVLITSMVATTVPSLMVLLSLISLNLSPGKYLLFRMHRRVVNIQIANRRNARIALELHVAPDRALSRSVLLCSLLLRSRVKSPRAILNSCEIV